MEDFLLELLKLFSHILAEDTLLDIAQRCLELWIGNKIRKSKKYKFYNRSVKNV